MSNMTDVERENYEEGTELLSQLTGCVGFLADSSETRSMQDQLKQLIQDWEVYHSNLPEVAHGN